MKRRLLFCSLALAASSLSPSAAEACGGFFCSQQPVLQTAERVIFEVDGEQVTAYVQLQYQGADPNFAWIVPVPEAPVVEVGVGAELFEALDQQTRPVFVNQGEAALPAVQADIGCDGNLFGPSAAPPTLSVRALPVPEVEVWNRASVGPFDYVTLSAETAQDLNNWLLINGYRVTPGSDDIVQAYLDDGMKLLALKLSPEAAANQVEPIKLTYRDTRGCAAIPVKLTAIAAVPGLEIVTWVFGPGRAVSPNFAAVTVDPGDLFSPSDYEPALAAAVDAQGAGHGFVTEYAQPTLRLSDRGVPALTELLGRNVFVTRLRTELDPTEMTEDPMFEIDGTLSEVSNEISLGGGNINVSSGSLLVLLGLGLGWRRRQR